MSRNTTIFVLMAIVVVAIGFVYNYMSEEQAEMTKKQIKEIENE